MKSNHQAVAEFGFYPFADIAWAYDKLWRAIAEQCEWLPRELTRTTDPTKMWMSNELFVSQSCGWPLITRLHDKVKVVGTFRHTTSESVSHFYRSVVLGRVDGTPFDFQDSVAAVNDRESLSGWISLIAAIHGPQEFWRGEVRISGSHAESVRMLCRGDADVASIDSVSLAHLRRIDAAAIDSLFTICNGPFVPCLPIIAHSSISDSQLAELRHALRTATRDQSIADATAALFTCGFDPLDLADYLPLKDLAV